MKLMAKAIERRLPALGATDGQGDNAVAYLKLFSIFSNHRWWITEYDPVTGNCFGYVTGGSDDEWGYCNIHELAAVKRGCCPAIERDMHFKSLTIGEVKQQFGRAAA